VDALSPHDARPFFITPLLFSALANLSYNTGIHIPTRVEPKVQLATERTFLSWLEISILLSTIASAMLNFSGRLPAHASAGFTLMALATIIYSSYVYMLRVRAVREHLVGKGVYYAKYGPTAICIGLATVLGTSVIVRMLGPEPGDVPLKG